MPPIVLIFGNILVRAKSRSLLRSWLPPSFLTRVQSSKIDQELETWFRREQGGGGSGIQVPDRRSSGRPRSFCWGVVLPLTCRLVRKFEGGEFFEQDADGHQNILYRQIPEPLIIWLMQWFQSLCQDSDSSLPMPMSAFTSRWLWIIIITSLAR